MYRLEFSSEVAVCLRQWKLRPAASRLASRPLCPKEMAGSPEFLAYPRERMPRSQTPVVSSPPPWRAKDCCLPNGRCRRLSNRLPGLILCDLLLQVQQKVVAAGSWSQYALERGPGLPSWG
jgi:hypothetical protein